MKKKEEEKIDQQVEYLELIEENNNLKIKIEEIVIFLKEKINSAFLDPKISFFRVKNGEQIRAEVRQATYQEVLNFIEKGTGE